MAETGIKRGQPITFRIPSDTSDHVLKQLQQLKEVERRNFSSKIAEFVINGVNDSLLKHREAITIPLPKGLTKAQRDWLKHEHSEALLGNVVYQLLADPVRTATLLASLNSQTTEDEDTFHFPEETEVSEERPISVVVNEDDLDDFDWEQVQETQRRPAEEADEMDPLGDFLAQMNK